MEKILKQFNINPRQLETFSPLTLAYIGDSFYEMTLRTVLVERAEESTKSYTEQGSMYAKATTQAKMMNALLGRDDLSANAASDGGRDVTGKVLTDDGEKDATDKMLSENERKDAVSKIYITKEEFAAYKRGRNACPSHGARNSSMHDYRVATGFEAMIGWLYLSDNEERAIELINKGWKLIGIEV